MGAFSYSVGGQVFRNPCRFFFFFRSRKLLMKMKIVKPQRCSLPTPTSRIEAEWRTRFQNFAATFCRHSPHPAWFQVTRDPSKPECTKIARFFAVAAAIFTAPPQNRAIFEAPRSAICSAKKIASERRFSLRLKGTHLTPAAEFPAIPESAAKIASERRCAILVHSVPNQAFRSGQVCQSVFCIAVALAPLIVEVFLTAAGQLAKWLPAHANPETPIQKVIVFFHKQEKRYKMTHQREAKQKNLQNTSTSQNGFLGITPLWFPRISLDHSSKQPKDRKYHILCGLSSLCSKHSAPKHMIAICDSNRELQVTNHKRLDSVNA